MSDAHPGEDAHPPLHSAPVVRDRSFRISEPSGTCVAVHRRLDRADGSKQFWWEGPDGTRGLGGRRTASLPLYRSETLRDAPADARVLIVEGEAAADAAAKLLPLDLGVLGIVNGAPRCPDDAAFAVCAGRETWLWPDADPPGGRLMCTAATALHRVGATSVRLVTWPAAPPKGDAANFAEAGGTAVEMLALLAAAVPISPEPVASGGASPSGDSLRNWRGGGGGREDSAATEIVELAHAAEVELFSFDEDAYATMRLPGPVPTETVLDTVPVRSRAFRRWLSRIYYEHNEKVAAEEAVKAAGNTLEGEAFFGDQKGLVVRVRIAGDDGEVILDLADPDRRVVRITAAGWTVTKEVPGPYRFVRPRGMRPLPAPIPGGDLSILRRFVNVATDQDFVLLCGVLVGALRPAGPYPVLPIHGEQGSAKSSLARVVRQLLDPVSAPLRAEPRDVRDLMIAARHSWVVAFDNLSALPPWLSDALCRLSTGGGFATRELYSDSDEIVFDAQRPVILTGIEELATRGDLLDRSIVLTLPPVPEGERRTEAEFWTAFDAARPAILGALCDAVNCAIRRLPTVHLDALPRLADFATWVTAAEPALGWADGTFVTALSSTRTDAARAELEAAAIGNELEAWAGALAVGEPWEGTASELMALLEERAGGADAAQRRRGWPHSPRAMGGAIRRLSPALRQLGVVVTEPERGARPRNYRIGRSAGPPSRGKTVGTVGTVRTDFDGARRSGSGSDVQPSGRSGQPSGHGWDDRAIRDQTDDPDGSDGLASPSEAGLLPLNVLAKGPDPDPGRDPEGWEP